MLWQNTSCVSWWGGQYIIYMLTSSRWAHKQYAPKQINDVYIASFAKLSNMYKIRKCITEYGAKTMIITMVTSGLNYCNSLYYGLPDCLVEKPLLCSEISCQTDNANCQVRIHHSSIALHWLPIKEISSFEITILLLTYKCFNGLTLKNC